MSTAQEIEALRAEVAELRQLVSHADRVRQIATERKLATLHSCQLAVGDVVPPVLRVLDIQRIMWN